MHILTAPRSRVLSSQLFTHWQHRGLVFHHHNCSHTKSSEVSCFIITIVHALTAPRSHVLSSQLYTHWKQWGLVFYHHNCTHTESSEVSCFIITIVHTLKALRFRVCHNSSTAIGTTAQLKAPLFVLRFRVIISRTVWKLLLIGLSEYYY